MKSFNHYFKKYTHKLKVAVKSLSYYSRKRLQSLRSEIDPRTVSPLKTDELPYHVNWEKYFGYKEIVVEIGTGHGRLLRHLAQSNRNSLHIGFEITKKFAKKSANRIAGLENSIAFHGEAYSLVLNLFRNRTISRIYILFPDPWHKRRHHKRRPLTTKWFSKVLGKLTDNGEIFFATDWMEYFQFVLEQLQPLAKRKKISIETGVYKPSDHNLIETHYYKKWKELGREFKYIKAKKL